MSRTVVASEIKNNKQKLTIYSPRWLKEIGQLELQLREFLLSLAFTQMQNYKVRVSIFTRKYKVDFSRFEIKLRQAKKENFEYWDDYLVWKALYDSYKKWERRYLELLND